MENSTSLAASQQVPSEEKFVLALMNLASVWNAKLTLRSEYSAPLYAMHQDLEALRRISILQVAQKLGIDLVKTGGNTYAMREDGQITSLAIFEKTNTWKRFSGKERNGISGGSVLDLVMYFRECSLRQAADFLSSRFL
jgi:hypothetical protein